MPKLKHSLGFTIIELLVVTVIIGLLAGLLLPAVSYASRMSGMLTCQGQLRQLGIATANYIDTYRVFPGVSMGRHNNLMTAQSGRVTDRFSVYASILPYMDQQSLYDSINFNVSTYQGVGIDINSTVSMTRIKTYTCPLQPGDGYLSYGINTGWWSDDGQGVAKRNPVGVTVSPIEISDGFSKTALMSEKVWSPEISGVTNEVNEYQLYNFGLFPYGLAQISNCKDIKTDPAKPRGIVFGSYSWLTSQYEDTYDHGRLPSSETCMDYYAGTNASYPASSHHDVPNILLCDGSVRQIGSIDLGPWRGLGTKGNDD